MLTGGSVEGSRGLHVMCSSVELPGVNIDTVDAKYNGHGIKIATGTSKDDINVQFLLTEDMVEYQTINMWKNLIVDSRTKKVGYFKDYKTDITVQVLSHKDEVVYSVTLQDAYPTLINSVQFDKQESDNFLQIGMAFTYRRAITAVEEATTQGGLLFDNAIGEVINAVADGNFEDAAYKVKNLKDKFDAGTLSTALGMDTWDMASTVLDDAIGAGANDVSGIARGLVGTVGDMVDLDLGDSDIIRGTLSNLF